MESAIMPPWHEAMDEFLSGKAVHECTPEHQELLLSYFSLLLRQCLNKIDREIKAYFIAELLTLDPTSDGRDRSQSRLAAFCDRVFFEQRETNLNNLTRKSLKGRLRGQSKSFIEQGLEWAILATIRYEAKTEIAYIAPSTADQTRARNRIYIPTVDAVTSERPTNDELYTDFSDAPATSIPDHAIAALLDSEEFTLAKQKRFWISAYCKAGGEGDPGHISPEQAMKICETQKSEFYNQMNYKKKHSITAFLAAWLSQHYPAATNDNRKSFFMTLFHMIELRLAAADDIPPILLPIVRPRAARL